MSRIQVMAVLSGLTLGSIANASVTYNWQFGGAAGQVANGAGGTSGGATLAVYGAQLAATGGGISTTANTTLNALFQVNDSVNNNGVGVAPYNPSQGNANAMGNQDGITDQTTGAATGTENFVLLQFTNLSANSTLNFLLQAGVTGDLFSVYTQAGGSMPTNMSALSVYNTSFVSPYHVDVAGNSQPSTPQASLALTNAAGATEWVAIQADCHYLLLNSVTGSAPLTPTPEPGFFGMLSLIVLGIGIAVRKSRAAAQA
jgi:hypothetical protein